MKPHPLKVHTQPLCVEKSCGVPVIKFSDVLTSCPETPHDATCRLSCTQGYTLQGPLPRCSKGNWNSIASSKCSRKFRCTYRKIRETRSSRILKFYNFKTLHKHSKILELYHVTALRRNMVLILQHVYDVQCTRIIFFAFCCSQQVHGTTDNPRHGPLQNGLQRCSARRKLRNPVHKWDIAFSIRRQTALLYRNLE